MLPVFRGGSLEEENGSGLTEVLLQHLRGATAEIRETNLSEVRRCPCHYNIPLRFVFRIWFIITLQDIDEATGWTAAKIAFVFFWGAEIFVPTGSRPALGTTETPVQ
jgi:hypothetical protein